MNPYKAYNLYKKRAHKDTIIIRTLCFFATGVALAILFGIIAFIFAKGIPAINWKFLSTATSYEEQNFGILPNILNTVYITVLSLLIVLPIGIGSAIYLSEYGKQGRLLSVIRYTIEILSGIPSIVYGLFGALCFVTYLRMDYSLLAGACTLAVITLPIIIRTTEESLKAVDVTYREAALSMGVNRLYIIRTILLPCAMPGIIAAVILSVGRMVGESAALLFTSGTAYEMPKNLLTMYDKSGATLTVQLYQSFTEKPHWVPEDAPFAIAAVLMIVVLFLNISTYFVGKKLKRK
ncbi:MAG: phosphate ABC transporter permease PstA [Oscillospiraceae bacterium]|nr:phosphate ABC transporter permease PstA [Oscillospiraceae bacterium]